MVKSWFPLFPYLNNISRIVVANLFPILLAMSYLLIAVCTCESYFVNLAPCFLVKSFETIKVLKSINSLKSIRSIEIIKSMKSIERNKQNT